MLARLRVQCSGAAVTVVVCILGCLHERVVKTSSPHALPVMSLVSMMMMMGAWHGVAGVLGKNGRIVVGSSGGCWLGRRGLMLMIGVTV